jgi:hypothetical protein
MDKYRVRRSLSRRGAMINGCLLLIAAMAIITTVASKGFAGYPPFHVIVATMAILFALVLARTPGTRWQVEALAAIGAPALASVVYAYAERPEANALAGTSGLLYVAGTAVYVVSCIVRTVRNRDAGDGREDEGEETKGEGNP